MDINKYVGSLSVEECAVIGKIANGLKEQGLATLALGLPDDLESGQRLVGLLALPIDEVGEDVSSLRDGNANCFLGSVSSSRVNNTTYSVMFPEGRVRKVEEYLDLTSEFTR